MMRQARVGAAALRTGTAAAVVARVGQGGGVVVCGVSGWRG